MISFAEMVRAIYGCWRLARRDPGGIDWLNSSPAGVIRSFWGPVLVLPGVLALQAIDGVFTDDIPRAVIVQMIAFVIGCTAFPLAVHRIAAEIGRGPFYARYLAAYNWSAVIQIAALLPVTLLAWLFPGPLLALISLVVTVALLFYQVFVARIALAVSPLTAALLVLLDLLFGTLIQTAAERIAG
jgi:hypothetical protein